MEYNNVRTITGLKDKLLSVSNIIVLTYRKKSFIVCNLPIKTKKKTKILIPN